MSATLATALLVQLSAVILLRLGTGPGWLRRPVTLLVLASCAFLSLDQVLLCIPSVAAWDFLRQGISQPYPDDAALLMSGGMLALVSGYLVTRPRTAVQEGGDLRMVARVLDWRVLAVLAVPLAALTYAGRGYNDAQAAGAGTALSSDLASTFFVPVVVIAAFAFLLRRGMRWFLPVLLVQSALLAAAGERTPVSRPATSASLSR